MPALVTRSPTVKFLISTTFFTKIAANGIYKTKREKYRGLWKIMSSFHHLTTCFPLNLVGLGN